MKESRKKIPAETEADVMFKSDRVCCIDQKRGDHIHHIDSNDSNNNFDNLALLCFDCHNEASLKGSLRKKLTPKTVIKYRNLHYKNIQAQRENFIKKLRHPISKLSSEVLLNAAKDALILIDISKIKMEYYNATWGKRLPIL